MKESGFNPQNLPVGEMFGEAFFLGTLNEDGTREPAEGAMFAHLWKDGMEGIDMRKCLIPAPGCHFNVGDLSQIEPRVLWALAGDFDSLRLVRQGMSPYEVHARQTMGYKLSVPMKKGDPLNYDLAKARVIALGYRAGWHKFIDMAKIYIPEKAVRLIFNAPVTEPEIEAFSNFLGKCRVPAWSGLWKMADEEKRREYVNSWKIVCHFRNTNPKIVAFWRKLDTLLKAAVGGDLELELPSGRSLVYREVAVEEEQTTGIVIKWGRPTRVNLYDGLICENVCQAIARDIFADRMLKLDDAGIWTALHAHDEAVTECPLIVPSQTVEDIMAQAPSWMPNLPVGAECHSHSYYTK